MTRSKRNIVRKSWNCNSRNTNTSYLVVRFCISNQLFGVWLWDTFSDNGHNLNSWLLKSSHRWSCSTANKRTVIRQEARNLHVRNSKICKTNLLNDAKLMKTSAVGCAAQATAILQRRRSSTSNHIIWWKNKNKNLSKNIDIKVL